MSILREWLHKRCGGRLAMVAEKGIIYMPKVVCGQCKMLWDDPGEAFDASRPATAKEVKDRLLMSIDENEYPD